ncbi:MAG: hypothetical protein II748_07380 [Clostridia bacterium]|nr:hypothetical protein [Clostridia bacterium]
MIFIFFSILSHSAMNIPNKEMGRRFGTLKGSTLIQDFSIVFWASIVMLCTGAFAVPKPRFILLSLAFGILYLSTMFLHLMAIKTGTLGDSTMMINLGLFLSALYGIFVYNDKVTILTGIGMACMLAVIFLSMPSKSERKENPNKVIWFLAALGSLICNGGLSIVKRIVAEFNKGDVSETIDMKNYLIWGYAFAGVICLITALFARPPKTTFKTLYTGKNLPIVLLFGLIAGAGTAGGNLFQMMAISHGVSSAIVYPVCAGSLITIGWLMSVIYYKDIKITVKNVISLILCVAGIVVTQIKI